jgi:AmiR/NasT family two-component response regulator
MDEHIPEKPLDAESPAERSEKTVLIVEDELIVAEDLRMKLMAMGYRVVGIVTTGEDSILTTQQVKPDVVLMDISLRGAIDGVEAARTIQEKSGTPIVYVTGHGDPETLQRAKATAGFSFVLKPVDERELRYIIEMALHRHALSGPYKR